ncbi:MAG: c-type cytochrome [Desulfonatronovibrionaceae bacterium]
MKKMLLAMAAALILACQAGLILAEVQGNTRKGEHLFKQNCMPCHMENAVGDEPAHYLGPDAKTQEAWKEVFADKEKLHCFHYWKDLSQEDLQDIHAYLDCGASDSDAPEKCGQKSSYY